MNMSLNLPGYMTRSQVKPKDSDIIGSFMAGRQQGIDNAYKEGQSQRARERLDSDKSYREQTLSIQNQQMETAKNNSIVQKKLTMLNHIAKDGTQEQVDEFYRNSPELIELFGENNPVRTNKGNVAITRSGVITQKGIDDLKLPTEQAHYLGQNIGSAYTAKIFLDEEGRMVLGGVDISPQKSKWSNKEILTAHTKNLDGGMTSEKSIQSFLDLDVAIDQINTAISGTSTSTSTTDTPPNSQLTAKDKTPNTKQYIPSNESTDLTAFLKQETGEELDKKPDKTIDDNSPEAIRKRAKKIDMENNVISIKEDIVKLKKTRDKKIKALKGPDSITYWQKKQIEDDFKKGLDLIRKRIKGTGNENWEFPTVEEAEANAANIPKGATVIIGGKEFVNQ
jgi:hypothetical protein